MASTLAGSRPSEKFGTHSIKVVATAKRIRFATQSRNQHTGVGDFFFHSFRAKLKYFPKRIPITTRFYL